MITRPAIVTDAHLTYLDRLQRTGATNMYGAGPYLQRRFSLDRREASAILNYWMESYEERYPEPVR